MEFTIIKSSTVPSGVIERIGRNDVWIVYKVKGAGSGSVTIPEEDFTDDAKIQAAVEANEASHGANRGRTFGAG